MLAGLFDFFAICALCALTFLVPLLSRGLVLPMWGVLLVMVGYSVVPLYAFKKTLGMALFKLELVGKGGHAVDPGNLLFRELIGRGFLPIAFLFTVVAGEIASLLGLMAFAAPAGMMRLYFVVCGFAAALAVLGHFLVLNRDDRRTLADLMAGSVVRVAVKDDAAHIDAQEKQEAARMKRQKRVKVLVLEAIIAALVFGVPWFLARPTESKEMYTLRLRKDAVEKQFKADPASDELTAEWVQMLRTFGDEEGAAKAIELHDRAVAEREKKREEALKRQVEAKPEDENATASLLEILEDQGRLDEAKALYEKNLGPNPDVGKRAGYGKWLASNDFKNEALAVFHKVVSEAPSVAEFRALYGMALAEEKKWPAAYEQLYLAAGLAKAAGDAEVADEVEVELEHVKEQRGPINAKEQKALAAQLSALIRDAGF